MKSIRMDSIAIPEISSMSRTEIQPDLRRYELELVLVTFHNAGDIDGCENSNPKNAQQT